jgi:signal transduction histidine kinase
MNLRGIIAPRLLVSIRNEAAAVVSAKRSVGWARWQALRWIAGCLLFAAAYYVAVQGGYAVKLTGAISAVWPPVGLAAGVLYLGGLRWWPGVVLGNLLATDSTLPNVTILGQTVGNLAEVLVIAILLRRLLGSGATVDRVDRLPRMLLAIGVGTAVSAVVGNLSLLAGGVIHWGAVPVTLRTWWLGDSCGALVLLPLILAWARPPDPAWRRSWEVAALICAVLGLGAVGLSGHQPLTYLVFPALIWGALRFGPQGGTVAVVLAVAVTVLRTAHHVGPFVQHSITESVLSIQLFVAVASLTTLCLAAIVTERRRGDMELLEARRRTAERGVLERQRIARDLHDSVSQTLFSMTLHARTAQRGIAAAGDASDAGRHELDQVVDLSRIALAEMRSLIFELRPEGLADEGLVSAIRKHAAVLASREGIQIEVHGPADRLPLTAGAEENLYRIAQEALANVIKHAQAGKASVNVAAIDSEVGIEIADDGRGFDPSASASGHMGLASINDRAHELGGNVTIHSETGGGTRLVAVVPIAAPEATDDA